MDFYYLPYNPKQNVSRHMKFDDCDEEEHLHKTQPKKNHWEAMHDFLYSFEEDKKISLYSLLWKYKSYEDGQVPKSI